MTSAVLNLRDGAPQEAQRSARLGSQPRCAEEDLDRVSLELFEMFWRTNDGVQTKIADSFLLQARPFGLKIQLKASAWRIGKVA